MGGGFAHHGAHRGVPSGEPEWGEKGKGPVQPLEMAGAAAFSGAFSLVRFYRRMTIK